jgi:cell division septal protein FtsQ
MKKQLSLVIAVLFVVMGSFAQTKPVAKTEKIKVWGNCEMCKAKIEKAAKAAGASYALWNEEAKILTVK